MNGSLEDFPRRPDASPHVEVAEASLLVQLRKDPRRVVLVGNYGSVNLGDELLLSVMAHWIREAGGIAVAISTHPEHTREAHGIEAVWYADPPAIVEAVAEADVLVLGGGGLFQDYDALDASALRRFPAFGVTQFAQYVYLAETLGIPRIAIAQGVGPLRSAESRAFVREVFERIGAISVRDTASARLLQEIGVAHEAIVAPDPGWAWRAQPHPKRALREVFPALEGRKVLGIIVRDWPFDPDWEDRFAQAFQTALPEGWSCLWIDFHRAPLAVSAPQPESVVARRLIDRLGDPDRHVVWNGVTIDDAWSSLAQCDASLAMRMHSLLLSHMAGLPTVALEYDGKVHSLDDDVGMPDRQRVPLDAIEHRLRPALESVTGPARDRAFRLTRERIAEAGRAAFRHRSLLWNAMATAEFRPRATVDAKKRWLSEWHHDADANVRRVVEALEARLHREVAAHAATKLARSLADSARTAAEAAWTAAENARTAADAQAHHWRAQHDAILHSRSYRAMAPLRWIKARLSRATGWLTPRRRS
jgi:polysaccharide pyruvyl transferase CsaB